MSLRNISALFDPASVAVIGASNNEDAVGHVVMRNLIEGRFAGPVMPVNPKYRAVAGVLAYPDVASLPEAPDLAVICTPAPTVPGLIEALGQRGTKAAVVVSGHLAGPAPEVGATYHQAMLAAAKPYGLRILGGTSLGVLAPRGGLNASFAHVKALPGRVAFVSQSGALCTAVLDWALPRGIGFSRFAALGDAADIGFDDLLDYLGTDPATSAILLYIESVTERRRFMAAARAAARNKPVIAVKADVGDLQDVPLPASTLSSFLATRDAVFEAALRRAGILRVASLDELFGAVETLARARPVRGDRIAVLSTGGGTGLMAVDELKRGGGHLARLAPETLRRLNSVSPKPGNPLDIGAGAPPRRYAEALRILAEDVGVDAILVMHAPYPLTSSAEAARAVIETTREIGISVLTCWVGGHAAGEGRRLFAEAGMANYDTPSSAVTALLHMVEHRRTQKMLMETPPSLSAEFQPDVAAARAVIAAALAEGRTLLSEPESKAVLAAYGMPVVPARIAADADEAAAIATEIGFPVALTVHSPDVLRKWDVGGVALTLETAEAVRAAALAMATRMHERRPDARLDGFLVQRMVPRVHARQLVMGLATDALFGPVVLFGEGGRAVEVVRDHAVGLPPLNLPLAREVVSRTRIAKLLQASADRPAADLGAVCLALSQVAQIAVDLPEVIELDINPLFADDKGVIAVDARMKVAPFAGRDSGRLAIRPYPKSLEEKVRLRDGREVLLRPVRPEDEEAHRELKERMTPEDVRNRFFGGTGPINHSQWARYTQIDYEREMAFGAILDGGDGRTECLGVVRTITDPDNRRAEFAIAVRSDMKGQGLGKMLMEKSIRHARERGTAEIAGQILAGNQAMIGLARRLGFPVTPMPGADVVDVRLRLTPP